MCWVREVVCALMHTTYKGVYMSSLCVHNVQAIVIFTEPIVRNENSYVWAFSAFY